MKVIYFDAFDVLVDLDVRGFCDYIAEKSSKSSDEVKEILEETDVPEYSTDEMSAEERWENFLEEFFDLDMSPSELSEKKQEFMEPNHEVFALAMQLGADYEVGILSDMAKTDYEYLKSFIEFSFFDYLVISSLVGMTKREGKEIFEEAVKEAGVEPEEILYIDNSKENCRKAESLGVKTVLYSNYEQLVDKLQRSGIDLPSI